MRLSISNLAWDRTEDSAIARLLANHRINAIDLVPGKYFPDPLRTSPQAIGQVRQWWDGHGIDIIGMQALLFGTDGLNVFGPESSRQALLTHLTAICHIGASLGARRLVFGSPKNRDRSHLDDEAGVQIMALDFFRRAGDIAYDHGVIFCLEPAPPCYGGNFLTTHQQAAGFVAALDHPAVRLQLDTGALALNHESIDSLLPAHQALVGHIHASEPQLRPLGDPGVANQDPAADHTGAARVIAAHLPGYPVTLEMLATAHEPHAQAIDRALTRARAAYRSAAPQGPDAPAARP
ncbi:sugar phosphate isomerase/epimerase [Castellaniella defragrans]|uniref:sugar phosphate isomerase/epimerase family protein n=1 Tax=Castellaniella defragrans TaxID=75697 RepID=UPI002AFEE661|nr:sugar phosphate isomerase/epimerase [Castellaniella defragrans]